MSERIDTIVADAESVHLNDKRVVRIERDGRVIYDAWPAYDVTVIKDEHIHGIEPARVPHGKPYESGEITADAGYGVDEVKVVMDEYGKDYAEPDYIEPLDITDWKDEQD